MSIALLRQSTAMPEWSAYACEKLIGTPAAPDD